MAKRIRLDPELGVSVSTMRESVEQFDTVPDACLVAKDP
jgi:hypothetical protein